MVRWRSDDGVMLKGLLYKPAGFDAQKQYPMVVYFYEQLSDNLHQYIAPFGRNVVNVILVDADSLAVDTTAGTNAGMARRAA